MAAPTDGQRVSMDKLDNDLKLILVNSKVPYGIIANFAELNYTSLVEFVEYFPNKEDLKANAPGELDFRTGTNNYDEAMTKRAAIRLAIPWDLEKMTKHTRDAAMTAHGSEQIKLLDNDATLGHVETLWAADHGGIKPDLDKQGNDTLLGTLLKQLSAGPVPVREEKHLVCNLDENLGKVLKGKRGADGILWQIEEEEGLAAVKLEEFEDKVEVHKTSYVMVGKTLPHIPTLSSLNDVSSNSRTGSLAHCWHAGCRGQTWTSSNTPDGRW